MEHSGLHALQLIGLIVALGGSFLVLGLLNPACRRLGPDPVVDLWCGRLHASISRWVFRGALAAALSGLLDLFVQVAEVQGTTIFGGVELARVGRFVTQTAVGRFGLARAGLLLLIAGSVRSSHLRKWPAIALCGVGAALCAGLVSHAAAQPTTRLLAITAQVAHLCGAAAWIGVLFHLLAARTVIQSAREPSSVALIAGIVRRFSPVALTAVVLMVASGVLAAVRNLVTPGALLTSAYGLTLSLKLLLLTPALFAGFVNYRVIRPALQRLATTSPNAANAASVLQRFGRSSWRSPRDCWSLPSPAPSG